MKTRFIISCVFVFLMTSTLLFAQKTEVTVRKGKILAETQTTSVNIDAGQKVVLRKDANPFVTVDSPLVHDALELYQLIEKEKQHSDLKIDSVFIVVGKADKDEVVGALYFEVPNYSSEPTNVMVIPYMALLGDFKVYDLKGNLCKVEEKRLGNYATSYSIHVSEPVQPGEHFKLIGVTSLEDMPLFPGGDPTHWREDPLLYFRIANYSPNALQYYRFILPESAILVDTNREIVAMDTVDGRLAVTMRAYTGPYSDGLCMIALLYPDEDGTTLDDIPEKYYGLRSDRDKENSETYQQEMHKIRAGIKHTDQSTPLAAALTVYGSAIQGDTDLYDTVKYTYQAPDSIQKWVENAKYWADVVDFLSTPEWPENPGNGYVHPIYMCRKGSLIREFVTPIVYKDGQWYAHDGKSRQTVELKSVTPQDMAAAERKGYLCDWEVAGPYIQKDKEGRDLFDIPFGPEWPDVDVPWRPVTIESDDRHSVLINIDKNIMHFEQAVAYLRTEIISDRQKPARLDIYTDDGVKAWLNGKLIHENNVGRGIPEHPDAVNVTLNEGVNHLMLKVTQEIWGWQATVKMGSDKAVRPQPTDKVIHPETQVQLDWRPVINAQSHRVYFGTDQNDLSLLAEVSEVQELKPLSLEEGRRYYWRVDEVLTDGSNVQGDVWSFTTGTLVAWWTFDGHAQDQSLHAFHGTLHGNPRWVPGFNNQALALDEKEDYIIIPPMNLNTNTITITLWLKTEEIVLNPGLVFTREGSSSTGLWLGSHNDLRYNWNGAPETWSWDSNLIVPNQTWTFAALTVDPEQATLYMHDGTSMKSSTQQYGHGVEDFEGTTYIGHDPRWGTVKGAIDEVRIYNEALDATEIEAIYLKTKKKPDFDKANGKTVAGDVRPILSFLDSIEDVNQSQFAELHEKYKKRFITAEEQIEFDDPYITRLYRLYTTYWRSSLLDPMNEIKSRKFLVSELNKLSKKEGRKAGFFEAFKEPSIKKLESFFIKAARKRDYFLLMGRTAPLRELMIWKKEDRGIFDVELPSERFSVNVVFAQEFLSKGWLGYATFNRSHSGGWYVGDTIYRVGVKPDDNNEWFRVSLLGHEGRHISDEKHYGELDGWILEYRAKLTELFLAEKTFWNLLNQFKNEAQNDVFIPHSYGSYQLIHDLIKELTQEQRRESGHTFRFEDYSKERLKDAIKVILDKSTQSLEANGSYVTCLKNTDCEQRIGS